MIVECIRCVTNRLKKDNYFKFPLFLLVLKQFVHLKC